MKLFTFSARQSAVTVACTATLALTAGQLAAQSATPDLLRVATPAPEMQTVLSVSEVSETLQTTVGHSRLLIGEAPFGTIIVGDDTIAGAAVGPGNSIILTGLAAGSTNLIVLDESLKVILSATVAVVPVAGPLRSTVTVLKGTETRETYECLRGGSCQKMAGEEAQREVSYAFAATPNETPTTESVSQ